MSIINTHNMGIDAILDLNSHVYKDLPLEHKFNRLAYYILNIFTLHITSLQSLTKKYVIKEIEFYYNSPEHEDPYVHCDSDQSLPYGFYFHKTGKSYKGGTYKGLDITFTNSLFNGKARVYGGIIIRSIESEDGAFIEGPCNVVDHILSTTSQPSIDTLVETLPKDQTNTIPSIFKVGESQSLYLSINHLKESQTICRSIRVGLNPKHSIDYFMKMYRFLTSPDKVKKYRNSIVLDLYFRGVDISVIEIITGVKEGYIKKYIGSLNPSMLPTQEIANELKLTVDNLSYLHTYLLK